MNNSKFKIIPAKPTFGNLITKLDAGDYIKKKSATTVLCPILNCRTNSKLLYKQSNLINYKNLYNTSYTCCPSSLINKTDLNINLLTEENLETVAVLQKNYPTPTEPTNVDPNVSFINEYTIDPKGQLFGNTLCGLNNYTHYMIYKC